MKIALVFADNTTSILCNIMSLYIGPEYGYIELSLFDVEIPRIEIGKFVQLYKRKIIEEWPLIFEGYVSQCDKDKIRIEKHFSQEEAKIEYSVDFIRVQRAIFMSFIAANAPITQNDLTPDVCIELISEIGEDYINRNKMGISRLP